MDAAIPDLNGCEAYCEVCKCFREARRADECDAKSGSTYFEFICKVCHSILLTFQRLGTQQSEDKPAATIAPTARCPHCGEMNAFPGFSEIFAYVCNHCGLGVDATPRLQ
jgi:hypothetical protein